MSSNKVIEYIIAAKDQTADAVRSSLSRLSSFSSGIGNHLANIKAGFDMISGVVQRFAGVFSTAIDEAFKFEKATTDFKVLLGNIDAAKEHIADLREFASSTPLTFDDLSRASKLLLSFGANVESVMPSMKMLGDIAMGDSQKFQGLALVFAQVQSAGKLMGQDLLQMINQGFNPLTVISEKTGVSISDLKKKMEEGSISFEMVAEAMRIATSEGGLFNNAMAEAAKTGEGLTSTLQDKWNDAVREFGNAFSDSAKEGIQQMIDTLTKLVESGDVEVWAERTAKAVTSVKNSFTSLAPVVSGIWKTLVGTFDAAGSEIGRFLGAIAEGNFSDAFGGIGTETARAFTEAFDLDGTTAQQEEVIRQQAIAAATAVSVAAAVKTATSNSSLLTSNSSSTSSLSQLLAAAETSSTAAIKAAAKAAEDAAKAAEKAAAAAQRQSLNNAAAQSKAASDAAAAAQSNLASANSKVEQLWKYFETADGWKQYEQDITEPARRRKEAEDRYYTDYFYYRHGKRSLSDDLTLAMADALDEQAAAERYAQETAEASKKAADLLESLNRHFEEGKAE